MRDIVQIYIEIINPYIKIVRYSEEDLPDEPDLPDDGGGIPDIMRWIVYDGFKYILDFAHPINFAHRLPTDIFNSLDGIFGWLSLSDEGGYEVTFSQPVQFYQEITF